MDLQPGQAIQTKIADQVQKDTREEDRIVCAIKAIWPLDLFPDELIVREKTITFKRNYFMYSYDETILLKDVAETIVFDGFFSASLTIYIRLPNRILSIKALHRSKAKQAKIIIDGLFMKEETTATSFNLKPVGGSGARGQVL